MLSTSHLSQSGFCFEGVRFSPKVIEFFDVFEGKQSTVKIMIQNVGVKPVLVKMGEPKSFIFQMKKGSHRVKLLAAGTHISRTITYSYHNDDIVEKSKIPVEINGHLVEYPIVVKKAEPEIEVQPTKLDFEIINLGTLSKTLVLTILNTGGKRTNFKIDVGMNSLKLVVNPIRGTLSAKSKMDVMVELMGLKEGEYYNEIWVTSNKMPIQVPVIVEVLRPRLEIVHPNETEDFTLIDFPPTFIGTQSVDSFLLKNRSAEPTFFVTLAKINGTFRVLKDAQKVEETFGMFMLTAEEGHLEAFESRIVTVLFKPKQVGQSKGWSQKEKNMTRQWEYIVFFRIKRIHYKGKSDLVTLGTISSHNMFKAKSEIKVFDGSPNLFDELDMGSTENKFVPEPVFKTVKICLHGNAIEPNISLHPSSLEFDVLKTGETQKKVLVMTNANPVAIKYKYCKTLNIEVTPKEGWLQPKQVLEFLVVLTPKCAGEFKTNIKVEILAKSQVVFEKDKSLVKIEELNVPVVYTSEPVQKLPAPKIGLGITPMFADEVGCLKEQMTYESDYPKPYAAMLLSLTEKFKPKWMKEEVDKEKNVKNAMIAFPNDRPRGFHFWPEEKVCRTIFQGIFRYSPPQDIKYTFTLKQLKDRKRHNANWTNYLELLGQLRRINHPNVENDLTAIDRYCEPNFKFMPVVYNSELNTILSESRIEKPLEDFTPLCAMYLDQISVKPKIINFFAVAADTVTYEVLTVINKNSFSISIQFVPGKPELGVIPSDRIRVPPGATMFVKISFQRKDLGSYFGFLSYIINGSHQFKITTFALVTSKTLFLREKDVTFKYDNATQKNSFNVRSKLLALKNFLQFQVKYRWTFPRDSPFFVEPREGEVPPKAKIFMELIFRLDPMKPLFSELKVISESGSAEILKVGHLNSKLPISFTTRRIDLKEIPLNLVTKVNPIIRNACYKDVAFKVLTSSPMPGVLIAPSQGVMKARSFFPLDVKIQIPVVMSFSFEVNVYIQGENRICVKILGKVTVPLIRIRPTDIVMPRICAGSFDSITICFENAGKAPADVEIDFRDCPEYKIGGGKTKIHLHGNKSSEVVIYFHPSDVSRYVFYLPVIINDILGPPLLQQRETEFLSHYISDREGLYDTYGRVFQSKNSNFKIPCITINSSVSPPLLIVSSLDFFFQPQCDLTFQAQNIEFSNGFVDNVEFCIRTDDLEEENNSPFSLVPTRSDAVEYRTKSIKAHLKRNEKLVFEVKFNPKRAGTYSVNVPIYVKGHNNGVVFNYINLKGELKPPRLYPEYSEIHIPPFPLNVTCDVSISVYAENYRFPSTLRCFIYDLNQDDGSEPRCLSFTWLTDQEIKNYTQTQVFKLQLHFRSLIPVALRSYVVLIDSEGVYCTILVTAMSDNSTITTHAFLMPGFSQIKLSRYSFVYPPSNVEEKAIAFTSISNDNSTELKKKNSMRNVGMEEMNDGSGMDYSYSPTVEKKTTTRVANVTGEDNHGSLTNEPKSSMRKSKESSSTALTLCQIKVNNSVVLHTEKMSLTQRSESLNDVTYPNFPTQNTPYGEHFQETLAYVERWVFEVVMQCDQYLFIPRSFQNLGHLFDRSEKDKAKSSKPKVRHENDFVDFLERFFKVELRYLLVSRSNSVTDPFEKAQFLHSFFSEVLQFLQKEGCLLPHVKAEHLLDYKSYLLYMEDQSVDTFKWEISAKPPKVNEKIQTDKRYSISAVSESRVKILVSDNRFMSELNVSKTGVSNEDTQKPQFLEDRSPVEGREFVHESKILDATSFGVRSIQAWLDVILQIFKNFCLNKEFAENTIPEMAKNKMSDALVIESTSANGDFEERCTHILSECTCAPSHSSKTIKSVSLTREEKALLKWLNFHFCAQINVLWDAEKRGNVARVFNNFDKDLSDSIALIAVTAAHCPYVADHFAEVFPIADTQSKIYHNAAELIFVWRLLNVPLTVETTDIVKPNPTFMIMLVARLYDVLPSLHPRSIVCFSTPLTTDVTRTIHVVNQSAHSVFYTAKFFGNVQELFSLKESSMIEVKPSKVKKVKITFSGRKIQKVSATLVLFGSVVSPNFARNLAFKLEGVPSTPLESKHFVFSVPMYKVVCKDILLCPPYPEFTTYTVWYTTKEPFCQEDAEVSIAARPWSEIRHKKVSRRLFLNQCHVSFDKKDKPVTLNVTAACLTSEERFFWLIFRSAKVGDFIVRVTISATISSLHIPIEGFYPESWSPSTDCICPDSSRGSKVDASKWKNCPLLTELNIPRRNEPLWHSFRTMFLKTLNVKENSFWAKHLETNTGFCLILWLLDANEEEKVVDEFAHIFQTEVAYALKIEPPNDQYVVIPDGIVISDVTEKDTEIRLPCHISKEAPTNLTAVLTMSSESGYEIRKYNVTFVLQEKDSK